MECTLQGKKKTNKQNHSYHNIMWVNQFLYHCIMMTFSFQCYSIQLEYSRYTRMLSAFYVSQFSVTMLWKSVRELHWRIQSHILVRWLNQFLEESCLKCPAMRKNNDFSDGTGISTHTHTHICIYIYDIYKRNADCMTHWKQWQVRLTLTVFTVFQRHLDGSVQDCGISSTLAMEILLSGTKL